jgi:hypothetical protein
MLDARTVPGRQMTQHHSLHRRDASGSARRRDQNTRLCLRPQSMSLPLSLLLVVQSLPTCSKLAGSYLAWIRLHTFRQFFPSPHSNSDHTYYWYCTRAVASPFARVCCCAFNCFYRRWQWWIAITEHTCSFIVGMQSRIQLTHNMVTKASLGMHFFVCSLEGCASQDMGVVLAGLRCWLADWLASVRHWPACELKRQYIDCSFL